MKHIVCFSGGHSSALVAVEVCLRYGTKDVILLNHDINLNYEEADIKRFKKEVANFLDLPITYANFNDLPLEEIPNQFEVCEEAGSFINPATRQALCTHRLKTNPFSSYLERFHPEKDCIIYYGFDANEPQRVERRKGILSDMGYKSDYPLALWEESGIKAYNEYLITQAMKTYNKMNPEKRYSNLYEFIYYNEQFKNFLDEELISLNDSFKRSIFSTEEIGIKPPNIYSNFKHANCTGCLKGGKQHWYVVYCTRPDIFKRAKKSEKKIGYSIIKDNFLKDLEPMFEKMKCAGIEASEHIQSQTFWAKAKKYLKKIEEDEKPCECVF